MQLRQRMRHGRRNLRRRRPRRRYHVASRQLTITCVGAHRSEADRPTNRSHRPRQCSSTRQPLKAALARDPHRRLRLDRRTLPIQTLRPNIRNGQLGQLLVPLRRLRIPVGQRVRARKVFLLGIHPVDRAGLVAQERHHSHSPILAKHTRTAESRDGEIPGSRPLARGWASPGSRPFNRLPASQGTRL